MREDPSDRFIRIMRELADEVKKIKTDLISTKPVYTNQEFMALLDVSTATVKKWRDAGLLGYSQVGDIYLYSREDVESFLKLIHHDATTPKSL